MKRIALGILISATVLSCSKIRGNRYSNCKFSQRKTHSRKPSELVQETVNEQLSNLVNAETVAFSSVFPNQNNLVLENEVGKKVAFPNGTPF